MSRYRSTGFTLVELLVVVIIIGMMATISVPNITQIIRMNRIRRTANDLLIKARYARSLAVSTRRELSMNLDLINESFSLYKEGHTEYNLLEDIPGAIARGQTLDDQYILFVEKGGSVCVSTWNSARVTTDSCEYYFGESRFHNGVDQVITDCPLPLQFEPSGVLNATCSIRIRNDSLDREYELKLFKGGQMVLKPYM